MRAAIVVLLLASPASAADPVYTWQPKPAVVMKPSSPSRPLRGPLRVRLGTAIAETMAQTMVDATAKVIEEAPKAIANSIVDSIKRGDYQLTVTGASQTTPAGQNPTFTTPQIKLTIPRR